MRTAMISIFWTGQMCLIDHWSLQTVLFIQAWRKCSMPLLYCTRWFYLNFLLFSDFYIHEGEEFFRIFIHTNIVTQSKIFLLLCFELNHIFHFWFYLKYLFFDFLLYLEILKEINNNYIWKTDGNLRFGFSKEKKTTPKVNR